MASRILGVRESGLRKPYSRFKYSLNEDFFKCWTRESVWVYGWMLGDGSMFQNKYAIRINLSRIDKEVLYKIKDAIKSNHQIYDYEHWSKKYCKYYNMSILIISSKEICRDYSYLSYLDVPEDNLNGFIRGFFEAEGSISWNRCDNSIRTNFAQSNKGVLDFILFTLKFYEIVKGGSLTCNNQNIWQLSFGTHDSVRLYSYMYANCKNLFLERKKNRFEELIDKKTNIWN